MALLKRLPVHPALIGIYPVLALLARNSSEVRAAAALRSLIFCAILAAAVLLILRWPFGGWSRAALAASWGLGLFFAYGHVYDLLEKWTFFGFAFGRHRYLLPAWILLILAGALLIRFRIKDLPRWTLALNVMGAALVVFPVAQVLTFDARLALAERAMAGSLDAPGQIRSGDYPDIYYIILDGYSRADVLAQQFSLDNRPFQDGLAQLGFYVASCSQSNYAQTELSLVSSLNFDYLDTLLGTIQPGQNVTPRMMARLRNNRLRPFLKSRGYLFVTFATGFPWSELDDVDIYLSPPPRQATAWQQLTALNGFEVILLNTTAARALTDAASQSSAAVLDLQNPKKVKRDMIRFDLEKLASLPQSIKSPKFVFAHIIAPHGPYVLDQNGDAVEYPDGMSQAQYEAGYRDEVIYLNRRILEVVQTIQRNSSRPPVIILQGDHGHERSGYPVRMQIFNAYSLPGKGKDLLYPTITPVNTFRLVFTTYLGADLPLLPDISYFSSYSDRFNFTIAPNLSQGCLPEQ